jgi:hypothetical protein
MIGAIVPRSTLTDGIHGQFTGMRDFAISRPVI